MFVGLYNCVAEKREEEEKDSPDIVKLGRANLDGWVASVVGKTLPVCRIGLPRRQMPGRPRGGLANGWQTNFSHNYRVTVQYLNSVIFQFNNSSRLSQYSHTNPDASRTNSSHSRPLYGG